MSSAPGKMLTPSIHIRRDSRRQVDLIQIYDALVWRNPDDKNLYPGLAEKWEVSTDGKEYTFNLRKDVKFHNGEEFTSESVKFSYDRIVDPATKSLGRSSLGPYNRTETPDQNTAKVVFDDAYAPFLAYLSVTLGLARVAEGVQGSWNGINVHPCGTGPFMYKEYVKQDHFTMVRNPDYNWAPSFRKHQGTAYLDEIVWRIIPEPGTRTAALDSGQVMAIRKSRHRTLCSTRSRRTSTTSSSQRRQVSQE